jgi:tetratricopeptide (TPR) repeat protein/tRNA A-37 threonylcarbamoyl transferase component Bud32
VAPRGVHLPGYTLHHIVGRGGFGLVLSATRTDDHSKVAIKLENQRGLSGTSPLEKELEVLRSVGAPFVPAVFEDGVTEEGFRYAVMEYLSPPTLADRLQELPQPMPPAELFARAIPLAQALAAVHSRGFIHRDLKPENIFSNISPPGCKLIDFGIAQSLTAPGDRSKASNTLAGTAEYMSPEECEGLQTLDARADIYSLGVILYEMACCKPPFWGPANEVRQAHIGRRPTPPSQLAEVRPDLEEIILRCLAKDRERRLPDADALKGALEAIAKNDAAAPSPAVTSKAPVAAAAKASERRPMAVLFFESTSDVGAIQSVLSAVGGQLAHFASNRVAAVFEGAVAENPAERALRAADRLTRGQLAVRALVDIASVTVQRRSQGVRFVSPLFGKDDRYPRPSDPPGPLLTSAAADSVSSQSLEPVVDRPGIFRPERAEGETPTMATAVTAVTRVQSLQIPLVGRRELIDALLESALGAIDERRTGVATVVGAPGYGKSRVCAELVSRLAAQQPQAEIFDLRAREPMEGEAEETLRMLLGQALDIASTAQEPKDGGRELLRKQMGDLANEFWPVVALNLGWLPSDAPELKTFAAAPGVLRSATMRALGQLLRSRAQRKPLYILLDDAHFADELALDALEYAALREHEAPLWICAFARPVFEQARPSFGDRAGRRHVLKLDVLSNEEAVQLCRFLLLPAEDVPSQVIQRLVDRAGCAPMLLVELVRGFKRAGLLQKSTNDETWFLASEELDSLPDLPLVEWLAQRELHALPSELSSHTRLAALLGTQFKAEDLEGVLAALERQGLGSEFPLDARVGIRRLTKAGVLVTDRLGDLRFRSALMRDEVARAIPDTFRKQVHLAAHRYFASRDSDESIHPILAFHAAGAGLRQEAASLYLGLAERARTRHAYVDADHLYSRALAFLDPGQARQRLVAQKGRGMMRYRIGRHESSLADFEAARQIAESENDAFSQIDILLDEAMALDWVHQFETAQGFVERAAALSQHCSSPLLTARLELGRGRSLFRARKWTEARAPLESAVRQAEALSDEGYETWVVSLLLLGALLPRLGQFGEMGPMFERLIAVCRERGDLLHLSAAYNNRRHLWIALADVENAVADLEQKIRIARELGTARMEFVASYNVAELYYLANDLQRAASPLSRTIELEKKYTAMIARPAGQLLRARLLAFQGKEEEARAQIAELRAHQSQAIQENRKEAVFLPSEAVLLDMVELATRAAPTEEWKQLQLRAQQHSSDQEPIEVMEMWGLAAMRRGNWAEAAGRFEQALKLAAQIPNVMEQRVRDALDLAHRHNSTLCAGRS